MKSLGVQYDQGYLLAFKRCYCGWGYKLFLPDQNIAGSYPIYVDVDFKYVDESLVCDHSNESHWAVLSWGTDNLLCCIRCYKLFCIRKKPSCVTNKIYWSLLWYNTIYLYALQCFSNILRFVDKPECETSESYWAGPSCSKDGNAILQFSHYPVDIRVGIFTSRWTALSIFWTLAGASTSMWYCLLCCKRWFKLLSLWQNLCVWPLNYLHHCAVPLI